MSKGIDGFIEDEEMFSEIEQANKKEQHEVIKKIQKLKKKNIMITKKIKNIED